MSGNSGGGPSFVLFTGSNQILGRIACKTSLCVGWGAGQGRTPSKSEHPTSKYIKHTCGNNPQGEYPHCARTASAPRQVFEQLPEEMVYWERSCKCYLVGS